MTFSLCLADKQCWRFQAEAPLHDWLIKFATVLSLRTDVLSSTMTITFRIRNRDAAALPMPMYDFGILALRPDGSAAGWFCDIDTAFEGDFIIDRMIYALYAVYRETVRHEGLPFHAGLVEKDGAGILLAGSSGTGKSTACRRLADLFDILCDEETLIVRDTDGRYLAHPFPTWSGLAGHADPLPSWPVQKALPVAHILFLEPSDEDALLPLVQARAAMMMTKTALEKCRWGLLNPEDKRATQRRVFENACLLARSVPASSCRATLSGPLFETINALGRPS